MKFDELTKFLDDVKKLKVPTYEVEKLLEIKDAYFAQNCPFNVGDEVKIKDLVVNKDSGWWSSRHIIKNGAIGKLEELYFYSGKIYGVIPLLFDSYLDDKDVLHEIKNPKTKTVALKIQNLEKVEPAGEPKIRCFCAICNKTA